MSVNQPSAFVKQQERTSDAFLGGKLSILQPAKGFRAGLDSVLLGASVPEDARTLLDLGAGAGVAALTALAHWPALEATLVEIDPEMAGLAKDNIVRNGVAGRASVLTLDVTATGAARKAAGLATDRFDVVIANPPFFAEGTPPPDVARATARHMDKTAIESWTKTAVSSAHAQGEVIFIHTAAALPALLAAFSARMGGICVLPITPRPGAEAMRVLVRGHKGSRAPLRLLAPLVLHGEKGNGFSPEADAIFRGSTRLDWHKTL